MADYREARIERIENGWLVHLAKVDQIGEEPETILGIPLGPEDTWFAKGWVEAAKILAEKVFDEGE